MFKWMSKLPVSLPKRASLSCLKHRRICYIYCSGEHPERILNEVAKTDLLSFGRVACEG